jgi:SAM-dependent methyltransferase
MLSAPRMIAALRTRMIWTLDPYFPPYAAAYMEGDALTSRETDKAPESMGRYLAELGRTDVDVLDFGCGWGGETLWLARRVRSVVGVDVDADAIAQAHHAHAVSGVTNCRFLLGTADIPDASVDAVFSTDCFEHVQDLPAVFRELFRVLRPGGVLIARWGPLFYAPLGYHLRWACQVPYAHVLGGLPAITALRRARRPGGDDGHTAQTWGEMGLNGRVYGDYKRAARQAGFRLERFHRIAVKGLVPLTYLPWLSRFFIFGVDARLQKPR